MKKSRLIALGLFILAFGLFIELVGCEKATVNNRTVEKIPVEVTAATKDKTIEETISLSGHIEGINTVEVFPKISGRVEKLFVNKGDPVKTGQDLAVLEHSSITEQVKQFEAALEAVKSQKTQLEINLDNVKKDLERITSLAEAGAVPLQKKDEIETRYQAMKEQYNQFQAQIKQTEALLEQANIQEKEATLIAPIDGFVAKRYLEKGDMATAAKPVLKIVKIDTVKIITYLPEQYIPKVNTQTAVEVAVDAYTKKNEKEPLPKPRIIRIAPTLDPETRSAEIEIQWENPKYELKPGMFARVKLILDTQENTFVLPKDYIVSEKDDYFVFLVKDGKIKKQAVKLGIQSQGLVEITEGLAEGDQIITTTGAHLKEGTEVEIVK